VDVRIIDVARGGTGGTDAPAGGIPNKFVQFAGLTSSLLYALCIQIHKNMPFPDESTQKCSGKGLRPIFDPILFNTPHIKMTAHPRVHPSEKILATPTSVWHVAGLHC